MKFFARIWDGLMSLCAACATVVIAGVPAWYTHLAIGAKIAPVWAYACIVLLAFFALLLAVDFLRKARGGIAPLQERRR